MWKNFGSSGRLNVTYHPFGITRAAGCKPVGNNDYQLVLGNIDSWERKIRKEIEIMTNYQLVFIVMFGGTRGEKLEKISGGREGESRTDQRNGRRPGGEPG